MENASTRRRATQPRPDSGHGPRNGTPLAIDHRQLQQGTMYSALRMRQYQQQAVASASPAHLIAKLYDLGISACHRSDRSKLRAVLVELTSSLNFEEGGEIAGRLHALYEYCLMESVAGDLEVICQLLTELRDAWRDGVLTRKAA